MTSPTYSRKHKSLGRLSSNFLALYDREGVHSVGVDDAASRLGVERRRIYDITNILESVGILTRKGKNQYNWKGFAAMSEAMERLKEEGLRGNINASQGQGSADVNVLNGDEHEDDVGSANPTTGSQKSILSSLSMSSSSSKKENRKEKSLGLLAHNFIKLFVCSDAHMISLEESAKLLLGNVNDSTILKTRVRRLYDIANVLSSINLIEKTHTADTRKPAFRWIGYRPSSKFQSASSLVINKNEQKKRIFGADVTNISTNKVDGSSDNDLSLLKQTKVQSLNSDLAITTCSDHDSVQSSKKHTFGPFAPVRMPKVSNLGSNKLRRNYDWDNLASTHRPQYRNEAVRGLFGHYMDAWKSWYSEVAGQNHLYRAK